jgi:hypothetical protein
MKKNIVFTDNKFLGTPLGEWPKKPEYPCPAFKGRTICDEGICFCGIICGIKKHDYDKAITAALSQSTPIVETDYEKVRRAIIYKLTEHFAPYTDPEYNPNQKYGGVKNKPIKLIDGTVYKDTGIELVECEQFRFNAGQEAVGNWELGRHEQDFAGHWEYRRVYRVK